jgi:hypothetical protein
MRAAVIAARAWTWAKRVLVSFLMHTGFLPALLLLVWLEWLHESLPPEHPGMSTVLREIAETQERCHA